MDDKSLDGSLIKAYLLGELLEKERHEFEKRMMTDDDLYNQVIIAEDELVEEYALGRLSGKEKESFEASFLSTEEGREQVNLTNNLIRYASTRSAESAQSASKQFQPARRKPSFFVSYARAFAAAVIILAVGLGAWLLFVYESDVDKGAAALRSAYRDNRPVEARLTGFDYAPPVTLRGNDQVNVDQTARNLAERILLDEVIKNPGSASHHALGQLYLSERKFDDAIRQFEESLKADQQNARAHSDLGAALLEKGRSETASQEESRNVEAFAQSLTHLNRALELDPNLLEALFNRALLRQQMMFLESAAEDWRAYLEKDSNSSWADEAREHLGKLEQRQRRLEQGEQNLVEDFLTACRARDSEKAWTLLSFNREKLTAELLTTYLNSAQHSSEPADRMLLDALSYAGEIDIQRNGDRYTADLARFYRSASPRQLLAASEARGLSRQGRDLYMASQLEKAIELYAKAQRILLQVGNLCEARMATYWLGSIYLEMTQTEKSASVFGTLARDCEADGYRWLQGRALFYKSGIEFNRSEYSKALASAKQARTEAEKVNDRPCLFSAGSALIEYYRILGNRRECFSEISFGLPQLETFAFKPMSLGRHYGVMAMAFNTFGLHDAAIDCQREALRYAAEIGDFASLSVAYANLGLMYGKRQSFDEAFKNIGLAYAQGEAHAGEIAGQEKMAYAALQTGHLHREIGNSAEALANYNRSIELYQALELPTHLYQAYKGRLVCYIAQKDIRAVQQQLADILALMDKHRANIFEEENRNNFFDIQQSVYDLAIDFEYSIMQDPLKAFEYAEASRARSLLYSMLAVAQPASHESKSDKLPTAAQPYSLKQIQARIPADARLLQYAVLEDKMLIYIVSQDGVDSIEKQGSQDALTEKVLNYLAALRGRSEADREAASRMARELYGYLFAPVEARLGGVHVLHIIPDKVLNHISWDALISPASGKFLVEDYLVTLSPSATMFVLCTESADRKASAQPERLLSVGNPSFDHLAFSKLEPLPHAQREAKEIADLYPGSRRLLGPEAREQAVRDEMAKAEVAHFALHCVVDERSPKRSSLVLAKELPKGSQKQPLDGLLEAGEIYDMNMPRMRVAVLSACQTGVERYYRGEGMIGMARAFLVARVPVVVASLWPVDSKATAELMIRFHQNRKDKDKGSTTAEALWRAKRSMLKDSAGIYSQPFYWAAFQTIGGQASF
jgi:CHAT domain-containing protein